MNTALAPSRGIHAMSSGREALYHVRTSCLIGIGDVSSFNQIRALRRFQGSDLGVADVVY